MKYLVYFEGGKKVKLINLRKHFFQIMYFLYTLLQTEI